MSTQKHTGLIVALLLTPLCSLGAGQEQPGEQTRERPIEKRGLIRNEPGAQQGYTMFAPFSSTSAYMVDMEGRVVHEWKATPRASNPYLLDNGDIVFASGPPGGHKIFTSPGGAGHIQRLSWDGSVVWDFKYSSDEHLQHHDLALTPYGTVLLIAWEQKSNFEALENGRDPALIGKAPLWPDHIVEFEPTPEGAELIWEWHVWDHLIQDQDPDKANYGVVSEHPELVDINGDDEADRISADQLAQLQALGYVEDAEAAARDQGSDWLHMNAIDYNADLDQIIVSVPRFCEIWIIDHSTTFDEAAGHEGGNSGRGGDLLYRWGNPRNYRMGSVENRVFEYQHDARWVPAGLPGAGRVTVFNNGAQRGYSSIVELLLEPDGNGLYPRAEGAPFGPEKPFWEYKADGFFSNFISGAHRLPNGNTLICEGATGRLIEVTDAGKVVWEYKNPFQDPENRVEQAPFGLFRATRIPADHPALKGRVLRPLE